MSTIQLDKYVKKRGYHRGSIYKRYGLTIIPIGSRKTKRTHWRKNIRVSKDFGPRCKKNRKKGCSEKKNFKGKGK